MCPFCNATGATVAIVARDYLYCSKHGRVTGRLDDGRIEPMSESDVSAEVVGKPPKSGWYINPDDPEKVRFWSGRDWTSAQGQKAGALGAPSDAPPWPGEAVGGETLEDAVSRELSWRDIRISTADWIPGRDIVADLGEVRGMIVHSRGPFADSAARVRTAVGGEVRSYVKLMHETIDEATDRLRQAARDVGADSVIAMRYETTALTDEMVHVVAYGTAVMTKLPGSESGSADVAKALDSRPQPGNPA